MIKNYEGIFIFDPALKAEDLEKCLNAIRASITSRKGEIVKEEPLGKRELRYPINKHREGNYHILNFKAPSEIISDIKGEYKLLTSLIRFMIIAAITT